MYLPGCTEILFFSVKFRLVKLSESFIKTAQSKNYKVVLVGVGPLPDLEMLNVLNVFIVRADILDDTVAEQADLIIAIDQSFAVGYNEYYEEVLFIRDKLVPQWTIGPNETEVVLFGYGKMKRTSFKTNFNYPNNADVFADLTKMKIKNLFDDADFTMSSVWSISLMEQFLKYFAGQLQPHRP
uniref:Uncharacterized protein n=1 Tax=Parascaris equorum TaxID=6256 RepID=A0A914RUN3_PAREQ